MIDREYQDQILQLLLGLVDVLERMWGRKPRTKEMRDIGKRALRRDKT